MTSPFSIAPLQVVIAGGGSPGHVEAGLAVADALQQQLPQAALLFAGTGRSFERQLVTPAGYPYVALPARAAPQNPLEALRFVTDNAIGFCASRWMLREQQVSLVVGLGGYASAAILRAAVGRGIPTVLLEQNAVASRTTRWLSTMVEGVCLGFAEVADQLPAGVPVLPTGTPTRPQFVARYRQANKNNKTNAGEEYKQRERRLVVLGGAAGAQVLNQTMPRVVRQLEQELAGWRIVHRTGEGQLQATEDAYGEHPGVLPVSYLDEPASLLAETDLVVCRAGASTLAELALMGVPAVVVPFPDAADNHQMANAEVYHQAGACRVVDELAVGGSLDQVLASEIRLLVTDHGRRQEMATAMREMARPDAAQRVAQQCYNILYGTLSHLAA